MGSVVIKEFVITDRFTKVLAIIAFAFFILAIIIIVKTPEASCYEISIYNIYPWYFWIIIIIPIFIGQIILMRRTPYSNEKDKFWVIGFLSILTTNTLLLFMPFIRGYVIYGRGDVLTHLGNMKNIIDTDSIGTDNFYPINHILTVIMHLFTGIKLEHVLNTIPALFSLFYIISIYFLAKQIFERKKIVLFVITFTSILLFSNENLIFAPNIQSFLFLPFILFIYFKSRNSMNHLEYRILFVISLFLIVFFHPITILFLILIFLILKFCLIVYKKNPRNIELEKVEQYEIFNIISICLVTFFTWYFSFSSITASVKRIFNWFFYEIGRSEVEMYSELILRTNVKLIDLIDIILKTYGQLLVLLLLSFIFFSIFIFKFLEKKLKRQKLQFFYIFFAFSTLIFIIFMIVVFFNDFIINFGRIRKYIFLFSSIFVALSFYELIQYEFSSKESRSYCTPITKQVKLIKTMSLFLILILLLYFSIFNLYPSPKIKQYNQQVTETEISGMTWFFEHRNKEMFSQEIGISQSRFYDAIYGTSVSGKKIREAHTLPIDHFNYLNKTSLGEYYDESRYLLLPNIGKILYPELYPKYEKYWRFNPEDFDVLEKDNTVSKIYYNGNLNMYLIS